MGASEGVDWETVVGVTLAFLKFMLGYYGLSSDAGQTAVPTTSVTAIYRVREAQQGPLVVKTLQARLDYLSIDGQVSLDGDSRIRLQASLPEPTTDRLRQLTQPGRLTAQYEGRELLGSQDFVAAVPAEHSGVKIVLSERGRREWAEATAELVGEKVSLVLDGEVLMAPIVRQAMTGGELLVTSANGDCENLIFSINGGSLPCELELLELR